MSDSKYTHLFLSYLLCSDLPRVCTLPHQMNYFLFCSRQYTLSNFKAEQVAEQMTLVDFELFKKIEVSVHCKFLMVSFCGHKYNTISNWGHKYMYNHCNRSFEQPLSQKGIWHYVTVSVCTNPLPLPMVPLFQQLPDTISMYKSPNYLLQTESHTFQLAICQ